LLQTFFSVFPLAAFNSYSSFHQFIGKSDDFRSNLFPLFFNNAIIKRISRTYKHNADNSN